MFNARREGSRPTWQGHGVTGGDALVDVSAAEQLRKGRLRGKYGAQGNALLEQSEPTRYLAGLLLHKIGVWWWGIVEGLQAPTHQPIKAAHGAANTLGNPPPPALPPLPPQIGLDISMDGGLPALPPQIGLDIPMDVQVQVPPVVQPPPPPDGAQ